MKNTATKNSELMEQLLSTFRHALKPPNREPEPPAPKDEVAARMLRIFRAAVKRQEAEAELARELARFTVPDEI